MIRSLCRVWVESDGIAVQFLIFVCLFRFVCSFFDFDGRVYAVIFFFFFSIACSDVFFVVSCLPFLEFLLPDAVALL